MYEFRICKMPIQRHPFYTPTMQPPQNYYFLGVSRFIDILKEEGQEAGDIKECPMCQVLIQRDVGCAQMMCGNCKHIFCWHCRKSLDVSAAQKISIRALLLIKPTSREMHECGICIKYIINQLHEVFIVQHLTKKADTIFGQTKNNIIICSLTMHSR